MKHLICSAIIGVALLLAIFGYADVIGKSNKEVKTIANPILDNILDGMKTNDYAKYSRGFDKTMKKALPKKNFLALNQQIRNQIGDYKFREYLGFLNKGAMIVVLWKGVFDKSTDHILIKLVLSKQGDRYLVTGLWFQ